MKSVMISVKPKWCELISNGKKTIEVRKTRPKIKTPFKCYIYCPKSKPLLGIYSGHIFFADEEDFDHYNKDTVFKCNGKVIGEFVCDIIYEVHDWQLDPRGINQAHEEEWRKKFLVSTQLTYKEIYSYMYGMECCKPIYGWHISDLKIYDEPKELNEFGLIRSFQSWGYVNETNK